MATVGVIGCGSIGTVLARGFDRLEHRVVVNDTDPAAVADLSLPAVDKARLAANCEYIVIAVPTPTTDTGGDASLVADALAGVQATDATVILRSTMPPESTAALADRYDLPLVYSPEFLRDRSTVEDFFQQDRVVLAGPAAARKSAAGLLCDPLIDIGQVIETDDYLTAELGKYAHNAFFATKVSFANQMRALAEAGGADPATVMTIVTADARNTDSHLDPMLGPFGGACLPKDLAALRSWAFHRGVPKPLLNGTYRMNQVARSRYADHVIDDASTPESTVGDD